MSGPAKRPNVLLIMTDQQRADHTGFGGNRVLRTPHLDGLAGQSVVFDRAYVANPICMPNRASIMTGRVPSGHGVRVNGMSLDWGANTFARVARKHGYRTALIGKSHLQAMNDVPELIRRVFGDDPPEDGSHPGWPEGWDRYEDQERHKRETVEIPEDFYGFDHVRLTVFHSDLCSGHYYQWLLGQGIDPRAVQGAAAALEFESHSQQVWKTAMPPELYPTNYVADEAISFLEAQTGSDAPFLLKVSFPDPHHPFTPPGEYFDLYDPADIPLPESFHDPHDSSVPVLRHMVNNRGDGAHLMMPFSPTEAQFRQMAAAEYGMIAMIDDAVGRILEALEASGCADDTIIVFTSDHGDMFGDHGLMLKVTLHYEGCIRVPLTVKAPGIGPGRTASLASSIDLCPTLLELMDLPAYYGIQGESLRAILDDPSETVRDHVLIEEEQMTADPSTGQRINMRSLITDDKRLTVRLASPMVGDLYDLAEDPEEMRNLYRDRAAAAMRAELMEKLVAAMMAVSTADRKPTAQA